MKVDLPDEGLRELICQVVNEEMPEAVRKEVARASAITSPYLTVPEAAEYLRCGRQRIYNLISERRLARIKEGGRVLIAREELEAHLRGEPTGLVGAAVKGVNTSR